MRLLARFYDWLSPSDPVCSGDLIFVLAGRQSRKLFALELFRQGTAGCLLLSVGRFEIRKFAQLVSREEIDLPALAACTPPAQRHYFVTLGAGKARADRIPRGRLGTLGEIRALAEWLGSRPDIGSVLVVSSAPHLRRIRLCCQALLPSRVRLHFLATPSDGCLARGTWWHNRHSRALVLKELGKLLIYRILVRPARGRH